MADDIASKLHALASQLRKIAVEYRTLKFTASEEAMTWPLSVVIDGDAAELWCNKEGCSLNCEDARITNYLEDFTVADVLFKLIVNIDHDRERRMDTG